MFIIASTEQPQAEIVQDSFLNLLLLVNNPVAALAVLEYLAEIPPNFVQ